MPVGEPFEASFAVQDFGVDASDDLAFSIEVSRESDRHDKAHGADRINTGLTNDPKWTFSLNAWQRLLRLLR